MMLDEISVDKMLIDQNGETFLISDDPRPVLRFRSSERGLVRSLLLGSPTVSEMSDVMDRQRTSRRQLDFQIVATTLAQCGYIGPAVDRSRWVESRYLAKCLNVFTNALSMRLPSGAWLFSSWNRLFITVNTTVAIAIGMIFSMLLMLRGNVVSDPIGIAAWLGVLPVLTLYFIFHEAAHCFANRLYAVPVDAVGIRWGGASHGFYVRAKRLALCEDKRAKVVVPLAGFLADAVLMAGLSIVIYLSPIVWARSTALVAFVTCLPFVLFNSGFAPESDTGRAKAVLREGNLGRKHLWLSISVGTIHCVYLSAGALVTLWLFGGSI